jgi:hypothetical protein
MLAPVAASRAAALNLRDNAGLPSFSADFAWGDRDQAVARKKMAHVEHRSALSRQVEELEHDC